MNAKIKHSQLNCIYWALHFIRKSIQNHHALPFNCLLHSSSQYNVCVLCAACCTKQIKFFSIRQIMLYRRKANICVRRTSNNGQSGQQYSSSVKCSQVQHTVGIRYTWCVRLHFAHTFWISEFRIINWAFYSWAYVNRAWPSSSSSIHPTIVVVVVQKPLINLFSSSTNCLAIVLHFKQCSPIGNMRLFRCEIPSNLDDWMRWQTMVPRECELWKVSNNFLFFRKSCSRFFLSLFTIFFFLVSLVSCGMIFFYCFVHSFVHALIVL